MNVPLSFFSLLRWAVVFAALFVAGDVASSSSSGRPGAALDSGSIAYGTSHVELTDDAARDPSISEGTFDGDAPALGGWLQPTVLRAQRYSFRAYFVEEEAPLTIRAAAPCIRSLRSFDRARAPPAAALSA